MMMKQALPPQNQVIQSQLYTHLVLFGIAKALICGNISTNQLLFSDNRE